MDNATASAANPVTTVGAESPPQGERTPDRNRTVMGIVGFSHLLNHLQSGMVSVLYPIMMAELGFTYLGIGLLQTLYQVAAQGCEVLYGILSRHVQRSVLLGVGNVVLGFCVFTTGLAQNFFHLVASRAFAGLGSSAQHPVGSSILVSCYPNARGRILTYHNTAGNLGSLVAPAIAGGLLYFFGWRTVFFIVAVPSMVMGLSYFFLRDMVARPADRARAPIKGAFQDYVTCLKNRNVMLISLIQMAGAAGRGTGVNVAFLVPFFMATLGVKVGTASILVMVYQLGGLLGPVAIGWLYDRTSRKAVTQATLFFSTLTTLWLLTHHGVTVWLLLNLVLFGAVVNSRGSLTQAMVSEAVPIHLTDVAFSLYFFIGFISGPIWTAITGWLIDAHGFATAFSVISVSYLAGMVLAAFTKWRREV